MKNVRLADLVADFVATRLGVTTVFTVTGGGAMYLNDAFGNHPGISYVPMHHEQAAAMAAEGYFRERGELAVCQVTTGPGGTNAITGCAGAWVDSEAVLFISGQVESISIAECPSRQTGVQELGIISLVQGITKASVLLRDANMVLYELEKLAFISLNGRKGPVWLDIPLDVQNYRIEDTDCLPKFVAPSVERRRVQLRKTRIKKVLKHLQRSKRPLILIGNGCRSAASDIEVFINECRMPIVTGWNGKDLVASDSPLLLGSAGLFGNRAANLAVQSSDVILGIGYRFSVPQTGYDASIYAPNATIISVDVDANELQKMGGIIDIGINCTVEEFLAEISNISEKLFLSAELGWTSWCKYLKERGFDERPDNRETINSFDVNGHLEKHLLTGDTVVTDMGTSFTCTHQDLSVVRGVKLFTSSGVAAMGFGLPGAIGCSHGKRGSSSRTLLITGDGGLMFNIQELQSIVSYKLDIRILVYENGGYLTMKHMQEARFQRLVGSEKSSRLECPDFVKVASAFGIASIEVYKPAETESAIKWLLNTDFGPKLLVVHIDPWQLLVPRVQTRSDENGRLIPPSLDHMYPPLSSADEAELNDTYQKLLA